MKYKSLLLAFAVLTCLIAGGLNATASDIGSKAPEFSLKDVQGNTHNLADYKGKYVVLEWINFDCPFVVKHYSSKNMQNLQKHYADKGVIWLAVCSSAPGKQGHYPNNEVISKMKELGMNVKAYLVDEDGKVGKQYDARTTPHMYVINPDGILIYQGGIDDKKSTNANDIANSKNYVQAALDEAFAGNKVSQPSAQPYGCSVKYKD
jgi:glutathione peroxidase-family protein